MEVRRNRKEIVKLLKNSEIAKTIPEINLGNALITREPERQLPKQPRLLF